MESLSPTQQLAPFRLFCAKGKNVGGLRSRNGPISAQTLLKRQACQDVYSAIVQVLLKLNTSDPPVINLTPNLLQSLGSLVSNDTQKSSTQLDCVATAYAKARRIPEDDIDWTADNDETRILDEAYTVFNRKLISSTDMPKRLVADLKAYEVQLEKPCIYTEVNEVEESQTDIPPVLVQSSAAAQELADSVYRALEIISTSACVCPMLPKPHGYEMRLPLLAGLRPDGFLKLQMRKVQDQWQHVWIGLGPISDSANVEHDTGMCAQLTIASQNSHYLNFILREGTLHVRPLRPRPTHEPEFATEARSLESLVAAFRLGKKMIRVVALKLAWSAVYLYGGSWLRQIWNDSNIWFVERDKAWIPPHPHLGTRVPSQADEHTHTRYCFGCIKQVKSPHLLQLSSLGLMLMELHSGWTARQFAEDNNLLKDNIIVLAGHFFEKWRFDTLEEEKDNDYLDAVKACLDKNFGIEDNRSIPLKELQSRMLNRIVFPLYKSLYHYCPSRGDFERALSDEHATLTHQGKHVEFEPTALAAEVESGALSTADDVGGAFLSSVGSESMKWLSRTDQLLAVMEASHAERTTHPRVKIAVIDTGFGSGNTSANVREYIDFVEPNTSCKMDQTGHGTHMANLILRVYPNAELFIARIFRTKEANEADDPKRMAKAIKWASDKKVDIVSISVGFVNHKPDVLEAIEHARHQNPNLHIFAASSNYGNLHGGVTCPAKYHEYVFCVFSCSGNLKQTDATNPDPERDDVDCFAMLGEDVRALPGQPLNGSSVATALAAGFAARIIDFSRHEDVIDSMKDKSEQLSKRAGIRAVLRKASIEDGEKKFRCIAPWMLWQLGTEGQPEQKPQRKHVIKALEGILQDLHH